MGAYKQETLNTESKCNRLANICVNSTKPDMRDFILGRKYNGPIS